MAACVTWSDEEAAGMHRRAYLKSDKDQQLRRENEL